MNRVTDLATLLEGYRLSCTADGKSPQTTRRYLGKLRIFRRYLEETGGLLGWPLCGGTLDAIASPPFLSLLEVIYGMSLSLKATRGTDVAA